MGRCDLLQQSPDGTLVLGAKGERIVGHFSFYAVFKTPEEFRVEHAGRPLGSMAFDLSLALGIYIIFGGRRWKVVSIDAEAKVVSVEPAPGGRPPRFEPSRGGMVHDQVRIRMRVVYESADNYVYLNTEAAAILTEARQAYVRLGLDGATYVPDGKDTILFLCRGDRILSTTAVLLLARGLSLAATGPAITVFKASPTAVAQHVQAICQGPPVAAAHLASTVLNKTTEKYDWVLDEPLLCVDYASRALAVEDSICALRSILPD